MMRTFALSSAALAALLLVTAGVYAGSNSAWTSGYQGPTGTGYHPSYYGYPLGEQAAGYYGGGRYNEFYNFGRGYGVANYPGPLPGRGLPPDYRGSYKHGFIDPLPDMPTVKASPLLQGDKVAHIRIELPAEDAQVWIEDQQTQQAGVSRWFVSPPLEKNQQFEYRIRARWTENGQAVEQTQRIAVGAGDNVNVGFPTGGKKEPVATPVAAPPQFPLSE